MEENDTGVEEFAKSLVTERFGAMPEVVFAQLVKTVSEGIRKVVKAEIVAAIPAENGSYFDTWLDNAGASAEELELAMQNAGIDSVKVARHAMLTYRDEFLKEPLV